MTNKKIFKLSALVFIVAILIVFSISCKNKVTRANNLTLSGESTTEEVVKVDDNKDISQFENKTYKSNIEKIGPVSVVLVAKIVTPEVNESYLEVRYIDPKDENREIWETEQYYYPINEKGSVYNLQYKKANYVEGNGYVTYTREATATFGTDGSLTLKWKGDLAERGDIKLALQK